ncbi:MAG: mannose-6-phosphate isomerase [Bacteroidetes bacterium GWA2_32_17]|nr:MAG: mannose-6-phosphate isomerase [Bacteroidetes bacterium GWA2_32_17]
MLYPLKFKPIYKDKIWGGNKLKTILNKDFGALPNCGESWELSGVEGDVSVVANGFLEGNTLSEIIEIYMSDLLGEKVYEKFGIEFPLLIKFIDANDVLSIQVHPDDKLAVERHHAFGKTEMWYIIQADEGAELISGFNKTINKEIYLKHLEDKTLKNILNVEKVKSGNVFFIPAGRVHAIGSGILLAEIQQTSDVTYRIYDWDRLDAQGNSRELHTELALGAINFEHCKNPRENYKANKNVSSNVVECEYFTTNIIELDKPLQKDYNNIDSFVIYMCLEGNVSICYNEKIETLKIGETILIPAELKELTLQPIKNAKVLEVYIK